MIRLAFLLCLVLPLMAQEGATITFLKTFPGSKPEYVEIALKASGEAVYKEAVDDERPQAFQLQEDEVKTVFALAAKLDHFQRKIESDLPVARMGDKTLRWQDGAKKHEAKFNYSTDLDAQTLQDWFERMSESVNLLFDLERTAKFEPLGVNQSLLRLEAAYDRKRLVGFEMYYPLLNRVIKNDKYLNMARERAARLFENLQAARKKPE
jgi:hypothetical protein